MERIKITVIATGFELKAHSAVQADKAQKPQLSAADFFSGAFNTPKKTEPAPQLPGFSNIESPDFLKK